MCGIFGVVRLEPRAMVDREAVCRSTQLLGHRGPDADGVVHEPEFSFGHRRLSVIDLDPSANQPMVDASGNVFITYNGEIYNFRDLREELRQKGRTFRTASDTEVILQSYDEWGAACFDHFLGMFALGIYDRRRRRCLVARDRLGVKPAYFTIRDGLLLFASEPKALLAYPGVPKVLDLTTVSCFLSYRYALGTRTYFKDIHQLAPGHVLTANDGQVTQTQYWDVNVEQQAHEASVQDRRELKALIGDAVRRRMISDVPVGVFLSGGLDSSIIVCEMARTGQPVKTFTASFEGAEYDESEFASLVARHFRTEHCHVHLDSEQYLLHMRALIKIKDQPLGMHNEVAMYLLARELRKHVTVVLCGEGADELFDGYGRIFRTPFEYARQRGIARLKRLGMPEPAGRATPLDYFLARYSYFPWAEKDALYTPEMRAAADGDAGVLALFSRRFAQAEHRSYHDQISLVFETLHLPGLLQMLDTTTMAVGVEARTPFVDHRLVDKAFGLAEREKLRWRSPLHAMAAFPRPVERYSEVHDVTKYVLRELYRDELPAAIINRRKMGFPVPLGDWFSGVQRAHVRGQLLCSDARVHQMLDPSRLRTWFDTHSPDTDANFGRKVWLMLNLEYWLQEYF